MSYGPISQGSITYMLTPHTRTSPDTLRFFGNGNSTCTIKQQTSTANARCFNRPAQRTLTIILVVCLFKASHADGFLPIGAPRYHRIHFAHQQPIHSTVAHPIKQQIELLKLIKKNNQPLNFSPWGNVRRYACKEEV